jgi:hypothetical protein
MSDSEAPEPSIEELAQSCRDAVRDLLGFELDFTVETLPVLDHFCRRIRTNPGWADRAEEISCVVGAYFGEVLRQRYPCRWHRGAKGFYAWRLEFEQFFLCFNPLGVALEMLLEGDALGWNANFLTWNEASESLAARLRNIPEVKEEDFYTFSVRNEVLETVTDFLAGWTAKDPPKLYDPIFYQEQIALRGEPEIALTLG